MYLRQAQLHVAGHFLTKSNAAGAVDTSAHLFHRDQGTHIFVEDHALLFVVAGGTCTVTHSQILQLAFTALVTDRTIQRMVDEQELHHRLRLDEAERRAVDGVKQDVFYKGKVIAQKREYSDGLLTTLLKAGDPDRFADRKKLEHSGNTIQYNVNLGIERESHSDPIDVTNEVIEDDAK